MDFIRDFEEKVSQIEKYFQFVYLIENINAIENILSLKKSYVVLKTIKRYPLKKYISQDGKYAIEAELRKILKANAYLILYNLVEGALNSAMNEYFESFSSKRKRYKKFKPFIKKL